MTDPLEHRHQEMLERDAELLASCRALVAAWLRSPETLELAEQHFPAPWSQLLCKCGRSIESSGFQAHWLDELAKAVEMEGEQ